MRTTDTLRQLYYRSLRTDCNYTCSYCPFGRKKIDVDDRQDRLAWQRFQQAIAGRTTPVRLFLIPYGEALIHSYYREGIAWLAALPQVEGIGCQTNLSFPANRWLDELKAEGTPLTKLYVWASFHPEMTTVGQFVAQLHCLHRAGVQVCAGAVAHPEHTTLLQRLREELSPDIYLFLNAMQGLNRKYTQEEKEFFIRLDNLFEYDLRNAPADWEHCEGGYTSCYADGQGNLYACPRSRQVIGNLYTGRMPDETPCRKVCCDCYIAFSNLKAHPVRRMLGKGTFWRIPEKQEVAAVFFDIDGTLTGSDGRVPPAYRQALRYISRQVPMYLATSLSEEVARRKLGMSLFRLFRGGVFADGGYLRADGYSECLPISPLPNEGLKGGRIKAYQTGEQVYKYSLWFSSSGKAVRIRQLLGTTAYRIHHRQRLLTLTHPDARKKEGFLRLCNRLKLPTERVLVVGNDASDSEMLACTPLSCAVISADEKLKSQARYVLNPDRLAAFFHFHPLGGESQTENDFKMQ